MREPMYALLFGFATAFALTYAVIPAIIKVANERRIYDLPNERSSHLVPTPSLGGIGIFAGTVCGIVLWTPVGSFAVLQYILAAFVLIFFLGILDDLLHISPWKKLAGQVLVAALLAYKAGIQFTSFYGVFGIYEIPDGLGLLFAMLAVIGIVNAFNLIDGINGLAGSIGFASCALFGTWLIAVDSTALAVVAYSLAGAIAAFLRYNFTPAKIFMGDTGSLLIGTVCAILFISFIEINHQLPPQHPFVLGAGPAIAVAVLILPLYDTFSVILRRLTKGKSPFAPDKTHVHHQLISLGLSHTATTATLLIVNLLFVLMAWYFNRLGTMAVMSIEIALAALCAFTLSMLSRRNKK